MIFYSLSLCERKGERKKGRREMNYLLDLGLQRKVSISINVEKISCFSRPKKGGG